MKTSNIIIITLAVVLFAVVLIISGKDRTPITNTPPNTKITAITAADQVRGPETAPITLIEYSDFQCPACAAYFPIIQKLKEDLGEDLRFVYRHYPLRQIHPNAQGSAQAAEAAGKQGQFWEMHDLIFKNQTRWSSLSARDALKTFTGYAKDLGLDENKFTDDFNSDAVNAKIKADEKGGTSLGIPGTPTFFLNGQPLASPQSYENFLQTLQEEIAKEVMKENE